MAKMGVGGFRDAKYSFWGQNDVVLNKLSLIQNDVVWVSDNLCKMTLFWFLAALNDIVLCCI